MEEDSGGKSTGLLDVKKELAALADEKYREFHSRLIPGTEHISGVRVPQLWKLARRLAREEKEGYLLRAADDTYEEIILQGMVICLLKETPDETLKRLPGYIAKIDNWAECDIICTGLKKMRKAQEECLAFLKPCLSSGQEFEVRFGVVLLLCYFVDAAHISHTLELLNQVTHTGYYVKMAVAWAVSICFIKFPEETLSFLKQNDLEDWTYNKALQKITESYRVDQKTKEMIRGMKRSATTHSAVINSGREEDGES